MSLSDCSKEIKKALKREGCTVIAQGSCGWASPTKVTSTVVGIPPIDLKGIFRSRRLRARETTKAIHAGVSIVRVVGPANDVESHYHVSHLVGLVVEGAGWLKVPRNQGWVLQKRGNRWLEAKPKARQRMDAPRTKSVAYEDMSLPVRNGDVVVLPRGARHVFRCAKGQRMEYIALEFSDDKTDYQAHH